MKFKHIPIDQIFVKKNIRNEIDEDLGGLMNSIERVDILQPILVVPRADKYELVSGHRRFAAMKARNESTIPCIIRDDLSDGDLIYVKLAENIQRKQMTAREIIAVIDEMKAKDATLTDATIAIRLGLHKEYITYKRRIWKTYCALLEGGMDAKALGELSDGDLWKLSDKFANKTMSEAAEKSSRTRARRSPNGSRAVLRTDFLDVFARGQNCLLTTVKGEGCLEQLIEHLRQFKPARKTAKRTA